VYWNEILAFAKVGGGVETDDWRNARLALPLEHCRAALNDLKGQVTALLKSCQNQYFQLSDCRDQGLDCGESRLNDK